MVYALGFVSGFGAHAPSLPDIPKNRYLKVRKVGLSFIFESFGHYPVS
jgi:hypothetical protein